MTYTDYFDSRPRSVSVEIYKTVWVPRWSALLIGLALACGQQTKAPSAATSSPRAAPPPAVPASPSAALATAPPSASLAAPAVPSSSPAESQPPPGSAYAGCGVPIPPERLWDETSEAEVFDAIGAAKACARSARRRVLLEFVAPWCADCREMASLEATAVVARAISQRFERVRINVGKWDRHADLRESFGVKALATYVVIDPTTSKVLAKTTLEPITRHGPKLTADDWARWLEEH